MTEHRIELDTVRKHRSAQEYRMINRARCGDMEEAGDHHVIVALCRKMADSGLSGDVSVWRGPQLVFPAKPLADWAQGKALRGEQPEHLKRKT
jgi:hypothetical protein